MNQLILKSTGVTKNAIKSVSFRVGVPVSIGAYFSSPPDLLSNSSANLNKMDTNSNRTNTSTDYRGFINNNDVDLVHYLTNMEKTN